MVGGGEHRLVPVVVVAWLKLPVNWKLLMLSVFTVSLFVMLMVWEALVLPTGAVKLVIEFGVSVTGAFPEPFRVAVTDCELPPAVVSLMFRVAVSVPDTLGVKVTDRLQLLPPARVPVQGSGGNPTVKSPLFVPVTVTPVNVTDTVC